jgi:hypothetical protein
MYIFPVNARAMQRPLLLPRFFEETIMAHKKVERKKELDRRRHRRQERLKQRAREAKAGKA